jgi:hypothetical protein
MRQDRCASGAKPLGTYEVVSALLAKGGFGEADARYWATLRLSVSQHPVGHD